MKRVMVFLAAVGLTGAITFLLVTRHMADARADRLDRALTEAEMRLAQLESDLDAAKMQLADMAALQRELQAQRTAATAQRNITKAAPASTPDSHKTESESDLASAASPTALAGGRGPAVNLVLGPALFAAGAGPGLTNLVRIEGTSTIHNWQVESHVLGGTAQFPAGLPTAPGVGGRTNIEAKVNVFTTVRSLKSIEANGHPYSDAMDGIMYEKLLGGKFPRITYVLNSLALKTSTEDPTAPPIYEATGDLTVAGVTNSITMPVTVFRTARGELQFSGSVNVKMTDFKIEPPSPTFTGHAIKTGDDVTLRFLWAVKPVTKLEAAK